MRGNEGVLLDMAKRPIIIGSQDPRNRFFTPQLVGNIIGTLNQLDHPISFRAGGAGP